ncbi:MAG: M13 family metallopeptidase [Alphaproteobacteria bacterium]|nr:M13 family metallopeptidase [Alphaproteobacteria bacterium]
MRPVFLLPLLLASGAAMAAPAAPSIGVSLHYRDTSVKPGDDFFDYANGSWYKGADIPPDRSSIGVGYEVSQRAEQRNAELVRGAAAAKAAAGTPQRLIADYYNAYMDTAAIEARGLEPLRPQLAEIDGIATQADLARALGRRLRADVDPLNNTNFFTENLFGLWVSQSLDDPSRTVPYLLQGGLGMPDREYYLAKDAHMAATRTAYRAYVADLLRLAGIPDADGRAGRIVALEEKIAAAHLDRTASEDVHQADNVWRSADLPRLAPGLDWNAYLAAAGLAGQPMFVAWQPGAIKGLSALVASEPLQTWKDWLAFHTLNRAAPYLPKPYDELRFGFYGKTLQGTSRQQDRWKRALAYTNADLGDAVGRIYAQRYFPASSKAEVQAMVKNILAAFNRRIDSLTWMAPATKREAKEKVRTLRVGVGYPESWRDYAGLVVAADDPVGNAERAKQWEYRHQLAKLGRPVDRGEWWMTPQTVNAVNLPLQNALNFPAAILEAPYFDPKADAAANYGAIGAIIGHEISHSFDNTGAEFDALGKLANWWTPADQAHFKEATKRLSDQYSAYQPLPGLHVNGEQTLGENIADVAGLAAALDAYHMSLKGKPAPVIGGLTGDQRFFLAFAQAWRQKRREASLRQAIVTDGHAPAHERALTVRNIDAWYGAYKVQPGEKLYLAPKDRVRIW